jgi:uncharacterized protein (DUF1501 family)
MEPTTEQIIARLSTAGAEDRSGLDRRRFLQAVGATSAIAGIPTWMLLENPDLAFAAMATPVGPADGILISVTMGGGNDGLNTFIPIGDGVYYDKRPRIAIRPENALVLNDTHALNANLPTLKEHWDAGRVAVIEGVGQPVDDLSHFTSMARLMSGQISGVPTSGWLGRYIDELPSDIAIPGVTVSSSIPLLMVGTTRRTTALPPNQGGLFNVSGNSVDVRQYDALRAFGSGTELGPWGSALGASGASGVDLAARLRPLYPETPVQGALAVRTEVVARLINAGLGTRVFSVMWRSFDTHSQQPQEHNQRMAEFDDALDVLYRTLNPEWLDRVLVLVQSEFGRRVRDNDSDGTDHGAAGLALAIGANVIGGTYGERPSLTDLTRQGNLIPTVDFRQIHATVLDGWLNADSASILGATMETLPFLRAPGSVVNAGGDTPVLVNPAARRNQFIRLYLAYFLRLPDSDGLDYWLTVGDGSLPLADASYYFAESREFELMYGDANNDRFLELIYSNVLRRTPDAEGFAYWQGVLADGYDRGMLMIWFSESDENIEVTAPMVAQYNLAT